MFRLDKWYLDCIDDSGAVVIGYHARLSWRALRVSYAARLGCDAAGTADERWTVRSTAAPVKAGDTITWQCAPLGVNGAWRATVPTLRRTLHHSSQGLLRWQCLAPRADVTLSGDVAMHGTGYVERLVLTVPPWVLPIDTLLWGRVHAPGHTLVWIEWRGREPRRHIWHNGAAVSGSIDDNGVVLDDGVVIDFDEDRTLRDAPVLGTVATAVPKLAALVPHGFANAHERKRVSRAMVHDRGAVSVGYALHETVTLR